MIDGTCKRGRLWCLSKILANKTHRKKILYDISVSDTQCKTAKVKNIFQNVESRLKRNYEIKK